MPARIPSLLIGQRNIFSTIPSKIEIVGIQDVNGEKYQDCKKELDLKLSVLDENRVIVRYKVLGKSQKIRLWIEYETSKIHNDFYDSYRKKDFTPPVVVKLIDKEKKNLGEYEAKWNGRDQTVDKRLLLAGKYKVKIEGEHAKIKKQDETTIHIAKPNSYNYGIHYFKRRKLESTKKEVQQASSKQKNLKDGTGYVPTDNFGYDALNALFDWKNSSVVYWGGHSGATGIVFHKTEGAAYKKSDTSKLNILGGSEEEKWGKPPNASLRMIDESALKDLFLVVLNGCSTGNEVAMAQVILRAFNPGPIDGIHGSKTTKALEYFQKFNDLTPKDGTITPSLLTRLGLSRDGKTNKTIIREVQKKLKRYYPGKADGDLGSKTEKALRNYQDDHPTLVVSGKLDKPTFKALKIGEKGIYQKNISIAANCKGADLALGLTHKVDFEQAEKWVITFWDNLNKGSGIKKAASDAVAMLPQNYRKQFEFNIYAQEGVSKESTIHPARYGKSS